MTQSPWAIPGSTAGVAPICLRQQGVNCGLRFQEGDSKSNPIQLRASPPSQACVAVLDPNPTICSTPSKSSSLLHMAKG